MMPALQPEPLTGARNSISSLGAESLLAAHRYAHTVGALP